jgi:hypothetical protein
MNFRSRKLLDLAKGQPCVMCGTEDGTTVAAHSNLIEHGKGTGIKAHDGMTAWLCMKCHYELDQGGNLTKAERRELTLTAICRTYQKLWDQELIGVKS